MWCQEHSGNNCVSPRQGCNGGLVARRLVRARNGGGSEPDVQEALSRSSAGTCSPFGRSGPRTAEAWQHCSVGGGHPGLGTPGRRPGPILRDAGLGSRTRQCAKPLPGGWPPFPQAPSGSGEVRAPGVPGGRQTEARCGHGSCLPRVGRLPLSRAGSLRALGCADCGLRAQSGPRARSPSGK